MEKIWYIKVNSKPEGPFSIADLKRDHRLTPDTLVWKEGFSQWVPIRNIIELKEVFKDEVPGGQGKDEEDSVKKVPTQEELALDMRFDPPYLVLIIILILILGYLLTQIL